MTGPQHCPFCLQDWLGFGAVSRAALWLLFLAFSACAMQVGEP